MKVNRITSIFSRVYNLPNKKQRGSFIVLFAFSILPIIVTAGLMMDSAWIYACHRDMQNSADNLAIIGVKKLVKEGPTAAEFEIINQAENFKVGGRPTVIDPLNIRFGAFDYDSDTFTETFYNQNTVEVTIRRVEDTPNGAVPLFMSQIFGKKSINLSTTAYASLSSLDLILALDLSDSMDDNQTCIEWGEGGGGGGGDDDDDDDDGGGGGKVTICHKPGTPAEKSKAVPPSAVPGHLGHGDYLGSCAATCTKWVKQPIEEVKTATIRFLDKLRNSYDRVGLISYETKSNLIQHFTSNYQNIENDIEDLSVGGDTNIGSALERSRDEFQNYSRNVSAKTIILLSDGTANCRTYTNSCGSTYSHKQNGKNYALQQAYLSDSENTTIFTISLGPDADRSLLQDIAELTGGHEFYAPTKDDLQNTFKEIAKQLPVKLAL